MGCHGLEAIVACMAGSKGLLADRFEATRRSRDDEFLPRYRPPRCPVRLPGVARALQHKRRHKLIVTASPGDMVVHLMPDGVTGAARLGAPLDEPRRELDRPFDEWEAATRRMEAVG